MTYDTMIFRIFVTGLMERAPFYQKIRDFVSLGFLRKDHQFMISRLQPLDRHRLVNINNKTIVSASPDDTGNRSREREKSTRDEHTDRGRMQLASRLIFVGERKRATGVFHRRVGRVEENERLKLTMNRQVTAEVIEREPGIS